MISADEFITSVDRTRNRNPKLLSKDEHEILNYAIGLAGEVGEVVEIIKKDVFHRHPGSNEKIAKELGDVLWYVTAIAIIYGYHLEDLFQINRDKLRERYPEGFNSQDSINRKGETT